MPKILVADDQPAILRLVEVILKNEGWEVITAADGREALEKALAEKPDLVLLDIMMPIMDGIEALRQLGSHRETRRIPVVMLTAKSDYATVTGARESGVREYIVKPVDPKRLVATVRKVLRLPNPTQT
ncbi:MAG: response regulator [Armatimonadetes bacterium]|nr:response regulator [Armatimonadota bacterium]